MGEVRTVADLREALEGLPDKAVVIASGDEEGNSFHTVNVADPVRGSAEVLYGEAQGAPFGDSNQFVVLWAWTPLDYEEIEP